MNTSAKALLACAVTAVAATFSASSYAASPTREAEAHRGFVTPHADSRRNYNNSRSQRRTSQRDDHHSPNQQFAQYENGHFKGYVSESEYAKPNGH